MYYIAVPIRDFLILNLLAMLVKFQIEDVKKVRTFYVALTEKGEKDFEPFLEEPSLAKEYITYDWEKWKRVVVDKLNCKGVKVKTEWKEKKAK